MIPAFRNAAWTGTSSAPRSRWSATTLHIPRLFLAIIAISFFWAMGAVLAAQFPPLVKNALGADQTVATLFLATFSVGVAIGSVAVNRLLQGKCRARYCARLGAADGPVRPRPVPPRSKAGRRPTAELRDLSDLPRPCPTAGWWSLDLLGVAIAGGMFVVPLYAFLTTTVPKSETARTIAANNIVNSGLMVAATLILTVAVQLGVTVADSLLIVAVASVVAAWLGWKLHLACD